MTIENQCKLGHVQRTRMYFHKYTGRKTTDINDRKFYETLMNIHLVPYQ